MHHIEHGMSPRDATVAGDEGGVGARDRHRADPLGRVHSRSRSSAASPDRCTSSSRSRSRSRCCCRRSARCRSRPRWRRCCSSRTSRCAARSASSSPAFNRAVRRHHQALRRCRAAARAARVAHDRDRRGRGRRSRVCSAARSPPASSPTKTRASWASTCSCRPAPRSSARARSCPRWRRSSARPKASTSYQTIGGFGVVTSTYQPNFGTIFIRLKPWDERHGDALHVRGIMRTLQAQFAKVPEAIVFPFNIPTISGFGASAGFNFILQDRSGTHERRGARRARAGSSWTRRASGPSSATSSPRSIRATRR